MSNHYGWTSVATGQVSDGVTAINTALGVLDAALYLLQNPTIVTKTIDFTVAATDTNIICNKGSTLTITLPAASAITGRKLRIKTIQGFTVISASSNVVPLVGGSAGTAILAATAGKWADLQSDGTNWIIMAGN